MEVGPEGGPIQHPEDERDSPLSMGDLCLLMFGHAAFQYLYAGCALDVFGTLARATEGMTKWELGRAIRLDEQSIRCLLFGLVSLKLISKREDRYTNAPLISQLMEQQQWNVIRDTIVFEARIVYSGQNDFVESLRQSSNVGLRHIPGEGADLYHRLGQNPELQQVFYNYMGSWSRMAIPLLLKAVDFSTWSHVADVGAGDGTNAIEIAKRNPQLTMSLLDLPSNTPVARARIARENLSDRLSVTDCNMFLDPFPTNCDCFIFVHQLVIWPLPIVETLLQKAYEALKPGGAVVIFSSISNDSEDGPLLSALDSVYFVSIPAKGGMIYAWKDYEVCLRKAGFDQIERKRCNSWSPHGAIIAAKLA